MSCKSFGRYVSSLPRAPAPHAVWRLGRWRLMSQQQFYGFPNLDPFSTPVDDVKESMRLRYTRLGEASALTALGDKSRAKSAKAEQRGVRVSDAARVAHLLGNDTLNAAFVGEMRKMDGSVVSHDTCKHKLSDGDACYSNVWTSKAEYTAHLSRFLSQSLAQRGAQIFAMMMDQHYSDGESGDGVAGKPRWHFFVRGREVCMHTFLLAYPISRAKLYELLNRLEGGYRTPLPDAEEREGGGAEKLDMCHMSVCGWYKGYADEAGDLLPTDEGSGQVMRLPSPSPSAHPRPCPCACLSSGHSPPPPPPPPPLSLGGHRTV